MVIRNEFPTAEERERYYKERTGQVFEGENERDPSNTYERKPWVIGMDLASEGGDHTAFSFVVRLEGNMAQYGADIRRFVDAMVFKLEKNVKKGKWEDLPIEQAFDLLKAEVAELQAEVHGDRNMVRTMLEAADVANFALIVASIVMERGR
jgi:hypothetical protein